MLIFPRIFNNPAISLLSKIIKFRNRILEFIEQNKRICDNLSLTYASPPSGWCSRTGDALPIIEKWGGLAESL